MKQTELRRDFRKRIESEKVGLESERKVQKALKKLKTRKKIRDFTHSSARDDMKGKDFFVIYCGSFKYQIMPLQVKTSRTGQEIHKRVHPSIPSIKVRNRRISVLEEEIIEIIGNFKKGKVIHL